jgi:hypothetical protein
MVHSVSGEDLKSRHTEAKRAIHLRDFVGRRVRKNSYELGNAVGRRDNALLRSPLSFRNANDEMRVSVLVKRRGGLWFDRARVDESANPA